jgi:hypothetical protein
VSRIHLLKRITEELKPIQVLRRKYQQWLHEMQRGVCAGQLTRHRRPGAARARPKASRSEGWR